MTRYPGRLHAASGSCWSMMGGSRRYQLWTSRAALVVMVVTRLLDNGSERNRFVPASLPRRQLGVTLASPAECGEAVQTGDISDDGLVPGPGQGAVTWHVHDTRAVHDAATPACLVPGQESQLQLSLGSWFLPVPRELPGPVAQQPGGDESYRQPAAARPAPPRAAARQDKWFSHCSL